MIKIGITGKNGFIGTHLYNSVKLIPNEFSLIDFNINFFEKESLLDAFVMKCDVIVHLAAMNRHNDPNIIYKTNIELVNKLVSSLERVETKTHVIFASSSQEINDNAYGRSKKKGRILLQNWAKSTGNILTGLIIPNVFGPFGHPKYNSVIATFCHQISIGETPKIEIDNKLKLIYVGELIDQITQKTNQFNLTTKRYTDIEINSFRKKGIVYGLRVKDKFGDNGITGLVMININQKKAIIDSYLLSCRILGKKIEFEFMKYILLNLKKKGIKSVNTKYIKTKKNIQTENFFEKLNFQTILNSDEQKEYKLELNKITFELSPNTYKFL